MKNRQVIWQFNIILQGFFLCVCEGGGTFECDYLLSAKILSLISPDKIGQPINQSGPAFSVASAQFSYLSNSTRQLQCKSGVSLSSYKPHIELRCPQRPPPGPVKLAQSARRCATPFAFSSHPRPASEGDSFCWRRNTPPLQFILWSSPQRQKKKYSTSKEQITRSYFNI